MKKENKQMDKNQILNEIFANDPLNLLEVKAKSSIISNDDRLLGSFEEINNFYEENNREPTKSNDRIERQLYSRLQWIREKQEKINYLKEHDKHNLLKDIEKMPEINSIDDILSNDLLWIFDEKEDSIFNVKHVPEIKQERSDADFVATRVKCDNFEEYEHLFIGCQNDLASWKKKLAPSIEKELKVWTFCVLDWVLLYIANIYQEYRWNSNKLNRRTLIIFENWTQSNMLLRSLWKRLKDSWKMVIDVVHNKLFAINNEDTQNWYIYILQSLSKDESISTIKNLYKIWFSTTTIEERIKNAEKDPTYLMAPVKIIEAFQCYNMNPQKLENLIHRFFWNACLNLDIIDKNWNRYIPREWFIVPLDVIIETIELIINWEIVKYKYNEEHERIIEK